MSIVDFIAVVSFGLTRFVLDILASDIKPQK